MSVTELWGPGAAHGDGKLGVRRLGRGQHAFREREGTGGKDLSV